MKNGDLVVRPFLDRDASSWLRCRLLAFLDTNYFDDVVTAKPTYSLPSVELVAVDDDEVVGVMDVAIDGALATIETVATHPDHARRGIARELLAEAVRRIPPTVDTLDAWTREDVAANGWYVASKFIETFRYLHVYAETPSEVASAVVSTQQGLTPVRSFFHAAIGDESVLREQYDRVYVCRRYERALPS